VKLAPCVFFSIVIVVALAAAAGDALALKPLIGCAKQCGMDADGVLSCRTVCSVGGLTPGQAETVCKNICTEFTCKPLAGHTISTKCLHTCEKRCYR